MRIWGIDRQIRKELISGRTADRFSGSGSLFYSVRLEPVMEDRLPDLRTAIQTVWIVVWKGAKPQDLGLEKKLKIPEKNA